MFEKWKEKREQTMARNKAILESKYWREHVLLHHCIDLMRGSCTVAPMDMHEAAVAAVNIALSENCWQTLEELIEIARLSDTDELLSLLGFRYRA